MADYGLKISKPGYDIATADDRYLSLSTKYNLFKVFSSGATTVTASGTTTITHNLNYIPNYLVYIEDPANASRMWICSASRIAIYAKVYATSTTLVITDTYGSGTRDIYYYIMNDTM